MLVLMKLTIYTSYISFKHMVIHNIYGGVHKKTRAINRGYALPTVLISGLVLLIIGASGMQVIASTSRSINDQYWNTLAEQAKESGMKYVETCLRDSADEKDPTRPWTNPLTQKTNCQGTSVGANPNYLVETDASNNMPKWRTSFTVSNPLNDSTINKKVSTVTGTLQILSASNSVIRTYTSQSTVILNITGAQLGVQVAKVAGSVVHTCVLLTNKKVYCAGDSTTGQVGQGTGSYSTPADIGPFPSGTKADDLTTNSYTDGTGITCIRADDSQISCIGYNAIGSFGNGYDNSNDSYWFSSPSFNTNKGNTRFGAGSLTVKSSPIVQGTANYTTTCAIGSDDMAYCAGRGADAQLGQGNTNNQKTPIQFNNISPVGQKVVKIIPFVESYTICVLTDAGRVYCHGNNISGQMGIGSAVAVPNSSDPTEAYTTGVTGQGAIVDFGAGDEKSCALYASGALYCAGKLPDASRSNTNTPTRFGGASQQFSDFSLGPTGICAVEAATSDVYCISKNDGGELGNGGTATSYAIGTPLKIAGSGSYTPSDASLKLVRVLVGDRKICLHYNVAGSESTTGFLTCAGYNLYGQFGNGTNNSGTSNRQQSFGQAYIMPSGVGVKEVYINKGTALSSRGPTVSEHSTTNAAAPICVLGTDGNAYCAGRNDKGQLGNTTTTDQYTPVRYVLPLDP